MTQKLTLKAARVNAGLTQKQLAKILKKSEPTIVKWENGDGKEIKLGDFEQLCKVLNVQSSQIIFFKN